MEGATTGTGMDEETSYMATADTGKGAVGTVVVATEGESLRYSACMWGH